jgi:hypothetical protein
MSKKEEADKIVSDLLDGGAEVAGPIEEVTPVAPVEADTPTTPPPVVAEIPVVEPEVVVPVKTKKEKSKEIYSKQFSAGSFPGNTLECQRELAKEAGSHLLGEGAWVVSSTTDKAGVVTQVISKK